jgi:hypothetical protein
MTSEGLDFEFGKAGFCPYPFLPYPMSAHGPDRFRSFCNEPFSDDKVYFPCRG